MKVINHHLAEDDGRVVGFDPTPNQGGTIVPIYLIMHYTAGITLDGTIEWFKNKKANASAHLIIGREGEIVQMVAFNRRAWHAGKSQWGELVGLNQYSIGIELVNAGKLSRQGDKWVSWAGNVIPSQDVIEAVHKHESISTGWHVYTQAQINRALEVAIALHERYDFTDILGHDDIAPKRKVDPGPAFPLDSFRSKVLGRND